MHMTCATYGSYVLIYVTGLKVYFIHVSSMLCMSFIEVKNIRLYIK